MENIQEKTCTRIKKLNEILKAVTAILLLAVLCRAMSVTAMRGTGKQLWKQAQCTLSPQEVCRMDVGDSYVYEATITPAHVEIIPLKSPLFLHEEIHKDGQTPSKHYYRITALKAGTAKAGISAGNKTASFPVIVSPGVSLEDRAQSYASNTDHLILVDITKQRVGIFNGRQGTWKTIKQYTCSSGAPGYDTPKGEYTVQERGDWFFNRKLESGAKWWVRFNGPYLFHSLEMDEQKNIKSTQLGTPLSHGCVRLTVDEAKWLYDHVPYGTKVIVY